MKTYDVIIIGAGPAGLMSAAILAKNKVSTAVIEQKKEIGRPVCCGEAVSEYALNHTGILDNSYIDKKVNGFRIFLSGKKHFYVESSGFLIHRDKFDKYLSDAAVKHGAEIFLKHRAGGIKQENNSFAVNTGGRTFHSRLLIGAGGPVSLVDKTFFKNPSLLIDAMQYKLSAGDFKYESNNFMDFFLTPLSPYYFWIFKKNNEINVGGAVSDKGLLDRFIREHFKTGSSFRYTHFSRGRVPGGGKKHRIYRDKVFLAGDAAGLTNPVSFAGIYSAIISGKICGEVISDYFISKNAGALNTYERRIKKYLFSKKILLLISKYSYNMPPEVHSFVEDYFEGSSFRKKDFIKFFKLAFKRPRIFKYIAALAAHRELLRYFKDKQW